MSGLPDTDSVLRKVPNCSTTPLVLLTGAGRKQNPTLIFRADYIEHHFEARATLPPILGALCNRLFLFFSKTFSRFYIQKSNDRLNGICSPAKYRHDCKLHERTKENETPE